MIGDAAKNQAAMNPRNTVFDAKRLIGRRYEFVPIPPVCTINTDNFSSDPDVKKVRSAAGTQCLITYTWV